MQEAKAPTLPAFRQNCPDDSTTQNNPPAQNPTEEPQDCPEVRAKYSSKDQHVPVVLALPPTQWSEKAQGVFEGPAQAAPCAAGCSHWRGALRSNPPVQTYGSAHSSVGRPRPEHT